MGNEMISIDVEKSIHTAEGDIRLNINTSVKQGELLAISGPSGTGKTTLLRMIAGLVNPDRGTIKVGSECWFDSEKALNLPVQKRGVGLMFQDYALFPNMTIEQNLHYAQRQKNEKEASELLELFSLTELRKRKPQSLSGGQKQRVALARALACKPGLLLLDEPLSALDAEMRTTLQDHILNAHKWLGATTLIVSHDLNEVFRLASRAIYIRGGNIVKEGSPSEVFDNIAAGGEQIAGRIVAIEPEGSLFIVSVMSQNNQLIKVPVFEDVIGDLAPGDEVTACTKALRPLVSKLKNII